MDAPEDQSPTDAIISVYHQHAQEHFQAGLALDPPSYHEEWWSDLPAQGTALDIGAGCGRDANAMRARGLKVVAVEPATALRELAKNRFPDPQIRWVDDALPFLKAVLTELRQYDLILCSGVWQHLQPLDYHFALNALETLLAPGGRLILKFPQNEVPEPRHRDFLSYIVGRYQLEEVKKVPCYHIQQENQDLPYGWMTYIYKRIPKQDTGLAHIRQIVTKDAKSATYKLGLLHVVKRIAANYHGMILERTNGRVVVPLGLVALLWIRCYKPLVLDHKLPQNSDTDKGYGFAKADGFYKLSMQSHELAPGITFKEEQATALAKALRDASKNIADMPANKTTYPGTEEPIFQATTAKAFKNVNLINEVPLEKRFLAKFGTFGIPYDIWDTCEANTDLLDPFIRDEWARMIQSIMDKDGKTTGKEREEQRLMLWLSIRDALEQEPEKHQTDTIKNFLKDKWPKGKPIRCLWSGKKLESYDVDHCIAHNLWANNDLWNLMPSDPNLNRSKGTKIPSQAMFLAAKERIIAWWKVLRGNPKFKNQFEVEAESIFGGLDDRDFEGSLFEALLMRRDRVVAYRQQEEWGKRMF